MPQFIHLLPEKHLGCVQFGTTMNKAVINIQVQGFFFFVNISFHFLRGAYSGVRLLGYMLNACSTLQQTFNVFFRLAALLFFILTSNTGEIQ